MAILTTSFQRVRTEANSFTNVSLGTVVADYNSYEATKAADTTKTWTVRIVNAYHDGVNHVLISEASYPERNSDPTGQVPEVPPT